MASLKYVGIMVALLVHAPAFAADRLVRTQSEYQLAVKAAGPGDTIRLANGTWKDFRILFEGRGTTARPITLTAQTKGKVVISGASDLRISGENLVVSGLVFRDGSAPGDELISFRKDSKTFANHVRLTEVVVDRFNKSDRRADDIWVALYGQDNRVDRSWFAGKGNAGVTLAVIRPRGRSEANRHRIDHNYFGPRPPLGSNGGETIRIGTSEESLSNSNSIVERNYFDRCDGEVEIISVKSGGNIVRENVIFESQGSIVLRHGNGNLVERNVILGNGKPYTGGVRVINRDQIVRDNYLEGVRGESFTSALAVMNGVPNSAINRYHQVANALIERNSFIDIARLTFGAGADAERTAPPVGSRFAGNLLSAASGVITLNGDGSGIATAGNVTNFEPPAPLAAGFTLRELGLKRAANGLLYPSGTGAGAPRDLRPVGREDVGPGWYRSPHADVAFGSGRKIEVATLPGALREAAAKARPGDTLRLSGDMYRVGTPIVIDRPLTVTGRENTRVTFSAPTLFQLAEGGNLRLQGFTISGEAAPLVPGNAVIRGAPGSAIRNYSLVLDGMRFVNMAKTPGFDVIATTPSTKAERLEISRSQFVDVSGTVVAAAAEIGKSGHYSAESVNIANSRFTNVGQVARVTRLGTDESTFGPKFEFSSNEVERGGSPAVLLSGVQSTSITGNIFRKAGVIDIAHSVGSPDTVVTCNELIDTPAPRTSKLYAQGTPDIMIARNGPGRDEACASRS